MRTAKRVVPWLLCAMGSLYLLAAGCDEGFSIAPWSPECEDDSDCTSGQMCLANHCYAGCQSDRDCSRWERCTGGVCQESTIPQPDDADIPDPPDADADVDADADGDGDVDGDVDGDSDADGDGDADAGAPCDTCPGDPCHGQADVCVECDTFGECIMGGPLCDMARGVCIDFASGQCAPCDPMSGSRCGAGLECVDRRGTPPHWESVCLTTCDGGETCPAGATCTLIVDRNYCVPVAAVSCTAWYANLRGRTCTTRRDCQPLGATATGVECSATGSCVLSCPLTTECPPGRVCTEGLCQ